MMPHRRSSTCQRPCVLGAGVLVLALAFLPAGCQEFVHMGQISDGESAFSIRDARIDQQQADGSWKRLGETDGNGEWWILKDKIRSGGKVRITKPGYYPLVMRDGEFLQQINLLMIPSERADWSDVRSPWGDGARDRRDR